MAPASEQKTSEGTQEEIDPTEEDYADLDLETLDEEIPDEDDALDFAVVDEMPVTVRGIDDRTKALAFQAASDLKPRHGTNTPARMKKIRAIGRFLKDYGYTVRVRTKDGDVYWKVIVYKPRQLTEEHLEKLREAGHKRKGQKRGNRVK